jgi:hypothetical protein
VRLVCQNLEFESRFLAPLQTVCAAAEKRTGSRVGALIPPAFVNVHDVKQPSSPPCGGRGHFKWLPPEVAERFSAQFRIAGGVLDVAVAEP